MKKIASLILIACLGAAPLGFTTACSTAPSSRVSQVQTLKAVGQSAEAVVQSSAHLFATGQITAAQARQVINFYDQKFQPVYRISVTAVQGNLSLAAPEELILLSAQLSALILTFTTHTP